VRSLDKLLDFLSCSFQGGTDVDKPLQLSLERLQKDEWAKVRRRSSALATGVLRCLLLQVELLVVQLFLHLLLYDAVQAQVETSDYAAGLHAASA
jgi:hypothetical protein